jgi:hypothetical protein
MKTEGTPHFVGSVASMITNWVGTFGSMRW